jgi:acetyl esterase/lipase
MTPWTLTRFIFAVIILLLASLAVLPAPTVTLFQIKLVATEYGHWLVFVALVVMLLGGRRVALDTVSMILGLLSVILFLSSSVRASMMASGLAKRFDAALPVEGTAPAAGTAFSWPRLFSISKPAPVEVQALDFAEHNNEKISLDFYPAQGRDGAPCVLVLHGGGWDSGNRKEFESFNHFIAKLGYAVAAMDYRLAPASPWPAQKEDTVDAIKFLQSRASDLNINGKNIVLMGRSSGGQIAQAVAYGKRDPAIRGVIAFYAPADMNYAFKFAKPGDVLNSGKLLRQYLGGTPDEVQKNYDSASGFFLARAESPPTLLIHGRQDELVWAKQSERLNDQLEQLGAPHFFIELPWATHEFDYNFNGPGGQISEWAVERFLNRVTSE